MLHVVTTGAYYPPVVTTWKILTTGASQLTVVSLCNVLGVGVGDFIEKIIDANILAFFQVSGKLSIKKNTFGGYQYRKI